MCMTFKLPTAVDGTVVAARSMEFPMGMPTQLAVLPADFAGTASPADGATWTARHGVVGMGIFGKAGWLVDGLNTEGVSAHFLYMPGGYCTYRDPLGDGTDLAQVDLAAYLLGTCATIDEVKAAVARVNVVGVDPGMGFVPPVHCLVHDRTGSVAIEFHPDGTRVVDNPVGVATNAPFLDWHLTNLCNFLGVSAENPPTRSWAGSPCPPLARVRACAAYRPTTRPRHGSSGCSPCCDWCPRPRTPTRPSSWLCTCATPSTSHRGRSRSPWAAISCPR